MSKPDNSNPKPPHWYWVISGFGLVWNLGGVVAFVAQMTMQIDSLPAAEQAFYAATPGWATAAFAVAVFGGSLGCLALLLRRAWALPMLFACLLGIILQVSYALFVGSGIEVFGPSGLILPVLTFLTGAGLLWFAGLAKRRNWLV